jgi:hypothetical protein
MYRILKNKLIKIIFDDEPNKHYYYHRDAQPNSSRLDRQRLAVLIIEVPNE